MNAIKEYLDSYFAGNKLKQKEFPLWPWVLLLLLALAVHNLSLRTNERLDEAIKMLDRIEAGR